MAQTPPTEALASRMRSGDEGAQRWNVEAAARPANPAPRMRVWNEDRGGNEPLGAIVCIAKVGKRLPTRKRDQENAD